MSAIGEEKQTSPKLEAVGGGVAGSIVAAEEKRILAAKLQRAANSGGDVLSILDQGAAPGTAGQRATQFALICVNRLCVHPPRRRRGVMTGISYAVRETRGASAQMMSSSGLDVALIGSLRSYGSASLVAVKARTCEGCFRIPMPRFATVK